MRAVSMFLGGLSLWLSGCSCGEGTELLVDFRTDMIPGVEFDSIEVRADGADAPPVSAAAGEDFASPRRVATFDTLAPGVRMLQVQLFLADRPLLRRRVHVELRGRTVVLVVITRDCRGVSCPGSGRVTDTECLGGRCVSPECIAGDPEACGPPECMAAGDCIAGADCIDPVCEQGVCLDLPRERACGAGEYCDPEAGCRALPVAGDAGMDVDAGTIGDAGPGCSPETCVAVGCETASCVGETCMRATTCADGETCCTSGICALSCDEATACMGMAAGTVCRVARGPCDAEERCDGASPACPGDALRPSGSGCRAAADACDVAEQCNGSTDDCPPNEFAPVGTACPAGSCNGLGTCLDGCVPGAPCATGDVCETGVLDCSAGSPRCVRSGFAPSSTVCRAAMGMCDVVERCTGSSSGCPADGFDSGTVCRPAAGTCDRPESCSGASPDCPADGFRPGTVECRASAGFCDVAEFCPGSGPDCGPNGFRSGIECRASAGECDLAEVCSGASADCPGDAFDVGRVCRGSAGTCDVEERCGAAPSCPPNGFASGVCRPSAGPCDMAESCSGGSATCPGDSFVAAGVVCDGTIAGVCDVPDTCTGSSADCPPRYSTAMCRASGTGDTLCDPAEFCTGSSPSCPPDAVDPDGTYCNSPRCGLDEMCMGGRCVGGVICSGGTTCRCGGEVCLTSMQMCP